MMILRKTLGGRQFHSWAIAAGLELYLDSFCVRTLLGVRLWLISRIMRKTPGSRTLFCYRILIEELAGEHCVIPVARSSVQLASDCFWVSFLDQEGSHCHGARGSRWPQTSQKSRRRWSDSGESARLPFCERDPGFRAGPQQPALAGSSAGTARPLLREAGGDQAVFSFSSRFSRERRCGASCMTPTPSSFLCMQT